MNLNKALEWIEGIKEDGRVGRAKQRKFLLPIQAHRLLQAEKARKKRMKKKLRTKFAA
jgi:hypothetical protein